MTDEPFIQFSDGTTEKDLTDPGEAAMAEAVVEMFKSFGVDGVVFVDDPEDPDDKI